MLRVLIANEGNKRLTAERNAQLTAWLHERERSRLTTEQFYALRKSMNMTQEELGQALDVSRREIVRWESGHIQIPIAICVVLKDLAHRFQRGQK